MQSWIPLSFSSVWGVTFSLVSAGSSRFSSDHHPLGLVTESVFNPQNFSSWWFILLLFFLDASCVTYSFFHTIFLTYSLQVTFHLSFLIIRDCKPKICCHCTFFQHLEILFMAFRCTSYLSTSFNSSPELCVPVSFSPISLKKIISVLAHRSLVLNPYILGVPYSLCWITYLSWLLFSW